MYGASLTDPARDSGVLTSWIACMGPYGYSPLIPKILPRHILSRVQIHGNHAAGGRRKVLAGGDDFANLVLAGGEVGEGVDAVGIAVDVEIAGVEDAIVVQVEVDLDTGQARLAGVDERVAVLVVED